MLSILIPNYNNNIIELVESLGNQADKIDIKYEVIIGDDASDKDIFRQNQTVTGRGNVKMTRQKERVGRSRIRNLLAEEANYEYLLFIDSDARVIHTDFLDNYLKNKDRAQVICGGTSYSEDPPDSKDRLLRWKYGKLREQRPASIRNKNPWVSFSTFNFLIHKPLFNKIRFDEDLSDYGHEDTLFGLQLKEYNISVHHIDNALLHTGLEKNTAFIEKTKKSLENLWALYRNQNYNTGFRDDIRLLRYYHCIERFGMKNLIILKFRCLQKLLERNLSGTHPSIILFQFYKLGYYCLISKRQ